MLGEEFSLSVKRVLTTAGPEEALLKDARGRIPDGLALAAEEETPEDLAVTCLTSLVVVVVVVAKGCLVAMEDEVALGALGSDDETEALEEPETAGRLERLFDDEAVAEGSLVFAVVAVDESTPSRS
jgi:hypothetical protein